MSQENGDQTIETYFARGTNKDTMFPTRRVFGFATEPTRVQSQHPNRRILFAIGIGVATLLLDPILKFFSPSSRRSRRG